MGDCLSRLTMVAVGLRSSERDVNVYGDEGSSVDLLEPVASYALALGQRGVKVSDVKALGVLFLAEVHSLQAAAIDYRRRLREDLHLVDVPKSHVVELGKADVAQEDDVVVSYHHAALGADLGLGYGNVGGEDGGDGWSPEPRLR